MDINALIAENETRKGKFNGVYDPNTGEGSLLTRIDVKIKELGTLWLPYCMLLKKYPFVEFIIKAGSFYNACKQMNIIPSEESIAELTRKFTEIRLNEDFEYWAIKCANIKMKDGNDIVPFKLRYAQRRLLQCLEEHHRWRNLPVRINLLKARQWGGSTLIQIYFNWIQVRRLENCNSIIVADIEGQARNIRGMFTRLIDHYPKQYGVLKLKPYEGSTTTRVIEGRGGIISVGSMQKPEASRSFDYQLAHLSEIGSWKKTLGKEPKDLVQAIRSGISDSPNTAIIQESTAKGTGNYWYHEWMASKNGTSGYYPFFVGFWEIELYQNYIEDVAAFIEVINKWDTEKKARAWWFWSIGATFEAIKWYFRKKEGENFDDWRMMAEFPGDDKEAFQSTGRRVFHPGDVDRMRKTWVCKPIFVGECLADADSGPDSVKNIRFAESHNGNLKIWAMPETAKYRNRYCVSMDIGGTTDLADWSVIRVFDRLPLMMGGVPEAVATWSGHLPQDLAASMAVRIACAYDNALFVPESNSLHKEKEGDHFLTVLNEITGYYENIYCRTPLDKINEGVPRQYGFHTNSQTKPMIISYMRKALREDGYVEYDDSVLVEYDQFELKDNGEYGAVDGANDDKTMATCIGYWIAMCAMEQVSEIDKARSVVTSRKMVGQGESNF